ncbi:SigE family RNA polymerase sigma factor [Streptomyces sp. SID4950]|nr:SigE family RNA polymerase sigma factor [Streptomyces sp. SID4950]
MSRRHVSTATISTAVRQRALWRSRRGPIPGLCRRSVYLLRQVQAKIGLRAPVNRSDDRSSLLAPVSSGRSPVESENELTTLYHHRRLPLVRLALLLVDDLPTAEDVVQDAFAALMRRHGRRLAELDDPEAYLRTSVINAARSVLRRRRTARAYIPERSLHMPSADSGVLISETHQEVINAVRCLTQRQREVLVLRYWSDLTEAQIADSLGVSRGTVKSTASRALGVLARQLETTQ